MRLRCALIDIGSSKITCLIAKINEQNHEYEVIGNSQNISKGFRLGNVTNIEDLSICIAKAVSASEKMAAVSYTHLTLPTIYSV